MQPYQPVVKIIPIKGRRVGKPESGCLMLRLEREKAGFAFDFCYPHIMVAGEP